MQQHNTDVTSGSDDNAHSSSAGSDAETASYLSNNPSLFTRDASVRGESQPASVGESQDPSPAVDPVAADAPSIAKPAPDTHTNPGEKQMKPAEKRINKLSAQKKELEERLTTQSFEIERMRRELDLEREFRKTDRSRLDEFGGIDKRVSENDDLREQLRKTQDQQDLYRTFSAQLQQAKRQAVQDAERDRYLEEFEAVAEENPLHSDPEISRAILAKAWQRNPQASLKDLAKQLNDQALSHYEPRYVEKFKGRTNPPAPLSPTGSRPQKSTYTDEDIINELDTILGKGWVQ